MEGLPLRTPAPKSCNTCSTVLQSNIEDNQLTKGVLRKNSTDSSMVCIRWGFTRALHLLGAGVLD